MKQGAGWVGALVGACVVGVMCCGVRAEQAAEPAKPAEAKASRAEAQKQHQAAQVRRQMDQVKGQIAERQKDLQQAADKLAAGKDEAMRPFVEKRIDYLKKSLDLLQKLQTALEGQNAEQATALKAQLETLGAEWQGGEQAARMDAERARIKELVGEAPSPELKAAWDAYNAAGDEILKKLKERQALEKELKDLRAKQGEAMQQLQREAHLAKQKETQQVKAAAPTPAQEE